MLAKLAAFLPSLTIGTISVTELLSRVRLAVSGHLDAGVVKLAGEMPSRLLAFLRADAHLYGAAMAKVLQLAFAPTHAALSLLAVMYQTSFAALLTVVHAAPFYLVHWL